MNAPLTAFAVLAAIGLLYVAAPIVTSVFFRMRSKRTVRCPETGLTTEIEIDARRAALTAVPGPPRVRVAGCALWPERRGCAEACLREAAVR